MKKRIMTCFTGIVSFGFGFFLGGKMLVGMINDYKLRMEHNLSNMMLLNDWLEFLYSGGELTQYFQEHQYHHIMEKNAFLDYLQMDSD